MKSAGPPNKSMISGPKVRKEYEKFLKFFFRWKLDPQESLQKSFSDGQGHQFQKFLKFFFEIWALLKSFKNDCPMVREKISEVSQVFFFEKWPPGKSWKNNFSGIPWNQGPSGPPLDARAPNSVQDSLNESSVRPNGTPVTPVLRSGLVKNPGWSKNCVNSATRGIITTTTNVSGGRSRRGKSFLYYSALTLAGTKKTRPKT